ncbi:MAG TPA: transposase [Gemmataceae bacterium]|jgi:transposase-like protein
MAKRHHTSEQIIHLLRQAEVEMAGSQPVPQVCRKLGVGEHTYYRWRKDYGGLRTDQVRRLKDLERENGDAVALGLGGEPTDEKRNAGGNEHGNEDDERPARAGRRVHVRLLGEQPLPQKEQVVEDSDEPAEHHRAERSDHPTITNHA